MDAFRVLPPEAESVWSDPDKLFEMDSAKLFSTSEKCSLWEMARSIVELPELAAKLKGRWKSADDICKTMKRQEYRVLWTATFQQFMPHKQALELVHAAYSPKE
jgi:hypothetical protein